VRKRRDEGIGVEKIGRRSRVLVFDWSRKSMSLEKIL
jgi:hypothetical protein